MRAKMRSAVLAATGAVVLISSTANAAGCWFPNEAKAAQLRNFHVMLMVGALHCRFVNQATVYRYNNFMARQRPMLDANANVLKNHFYREAGWNGSAAYDHYSTSVANSEASRFANDPEACARVDMYMRVAAGADDADLLVLAQSVVPKPISDACPPSNYAAAAPMIASRGQPIAVEPVGPSPAATDYAPAPDEAQGVAIAPTPPPPAAPVAESGPATLADAGEPAPPRLRDPAPPAAPAKPATPVSKADTMKAAIAALQAATAALQAATTAPDGGAAPGDATSL